MSVEALVAGIPGPRAEALLKSFALLLEDVLQDERRRISCDELTGAAMKLLEGCGFVKTAADSGFGGASEMVLPASCDIKPVHRMYEDILRLMKQGKSQRSSDASSIGTSEPSSSQPKSQTITTAASLAAELRLSAVSVSSGSIGATPAGQLGDDDDETLGAATEPPAKPRFLAAHDPPKKKEPLKVPDSVIAAAAAVSRAAASNNGRPGLPASLGGSGSLPANSASALPSTAFSASASAASSAGRFPTSAPAASAPISTQQQQQQQQVGSTPPPVRTAPVSAGSAAGASVWTGAHGNVTAESRMAVSLPEAEFTYIERPWGHFVNRWAAMDVEIEKMFGLEGRFSMLDLGSCCGFFSLQAAVGYKQAAVIGVEGSVGIGNGTTGLQGTEDEIVQTKAIQTHLRWIDQLGLTNCAVAPEVWDFRRVCSLASLGAPIADVMLSLSVIHHIDNVSVEQYEADGMQHVEGTLQLMAKLLQLAPRHFVELPDRPWMEHMYQAYGTARAFLGAAAAVTGQSWSFQGPLCISQWYGRREVWLISRTGVAPQAIPPKGFKALFSRTLGLGYLKGVQQQVASFPRQGQRLPQQQQQQQQSALLQRHLHSQSPGYPSQLQLQLQQHQLLTPGQQSATVGAQGSFDLGSALLSAPTALLAAHVQLREACAMAERVLREVKVDPPAVPDKGNFV